METWVGIAFSVVCALVTVAVSWGVIATKIEEIRKEVSDMKENQKTFIAKETCQMKHEFNDRNMDEIKSTLTRLGESLEGIKTILMEMKNR